MSTLWGKPLASLTIPGGEGKPTIRPPRKAAARSAGPPTWMIGTSLTGVNPRPRSSTWAAVSEALPMRLMPMLLPRKSSAVLTDSWTTSS